MQAFTMLPITIDDLRAMIRLAVAEALEEKLGSQEKKDTAEEYISREEAAALLRVSLLTLRNYAKRGVLKPRQIGRRVLYSRRDIDAALSGEKKAGRR